jgi:VWFA-related protein
MYFRNKRTAWILACAAISVFAVVAFQLRAQQAETGIPVPTIRVNTRLVLVDVVVTDKKGQAVTGLKPDDFLVEENGKKQKISTFSTPEENTKTSVPPMLPPGIYSNRPEYRSPGGPATVLLLDAANTPFRDQAYARLQMLKYVQEQNKPGQRIAIFTLTNSLRMLQDFTSDPQVLLTALKNYRPQEPILESGGPVPASSVAGGPSVGPGAGIANSAAVAADLLRGFQDAQVGYQLDVRVKTTLEAMRGLARTLGGMPGRKEVVWLTAAFPIDLIPENRAVTEAELLDTLPSLKQQGVGVHAAGSIAGTERSSYAEEIRAASAQLSNAQIAIYPVDVRGLISGIELTNENASNPLDNSGRVIRMSDVTSSQETMRVIADETGGRVYVNQNEIKDGVASAIADNLASYTLGYYPEDKKWNGKYRTIKIKVSRDGAQARYRRGYFAIDQTQTKERSTDQEIAEALREPIPATLVAFSARVKPTDKGKVGVDFLVDGHSLTAEDASAGRKLNVTFWATVFAPDGKMLANRSMKVDQTFNSDSYQQILQKGMLLHMDLDAQPANSQLRLAVRDERTGGIGTVLASLSPQ